MKEIKLTRDKICIVDDEDFEELSKYKWSCTTRGYAVRSKRIGRINGKRVSLKIYMHRFLTNCPKGKQVDHVNNNKLDNRKENLRICTNTQNHQNKFKPKNNTSGYKGVSYYTRDKRIVARIRVNGVDKQLGDFKTYREAGIAYNEAAIKYFGEFANLNIIKDDE